MPCMCGAPDCRNCYPMSYDTHEPVRITVRCRECSQMEEHDDAEQLFADIADNESNWDNVDEEPWADKPFHYGTHRDCVEPPEPTFDDRLGAACGQQERDIAALRLKR